MKRSASKRVIGVVATALLSLVATVLSATGADASTACSSTGSAILRVGSSGTAVRNLQSCLTALNYVPHGIDGHFGENTAHAVMTFQKDHGLGRDSAVGPQVRAALRVARPVAMPTSCRRIDRTCVSLSKQVMYLRLPSGVIKAIDTSSGTGKLYTTTQGTVARAVTPIGRAVICRKVSGLDRSSSVKNGVLYDPAYLRYAGKSRCSGIAFHGEPGANSVPGYPASHGCMRVTMPNSLQQYNNVRIGSPVSVVR